jgi:hypothetical protein
MNTLFSTLLLLVPMAADEKPIPKVPIGKETTFATGPIDAGGYIDYEAALNDRLREKITPQTNAVVLLVKAFGPGPAGSEYPPGFLKLVGMDELPAKGEYFYGLDQHLKDNLHLPPNEFDTVYDQQSKATKRPWAIQDYPHVGAWLIGNEKALAIVVEATTRPHYFLPRVTRRDANGKRDLLIGAPLPNVQKCRELAKALAARAMCRLNEGKDDQAWQDLLATHRLAALVSSGSSLLEFLVGVAIDAVACQADLAYLEHAKLTAKQLQVRLKELQALPSMAPVAGKVDLEVRFTYLDSLQSLLRGGVTAIPGLTDAPNEVDLQEQKRILEKIDWSPAFQEGNKWYDRMVAALKIKDRAAREKQFDRIDEELNALKINAEKEKELFAELTKPGGQPDKVVSKAIGDVLIRLLMPAVRKVQGAWERSEQIRYNVQIAFALAAYRLDNQRYPAKLDGLAPKYLAAVPLDVFTGKPLTYHPKDNGYLFYSFGENGKDDDGRWHTDEPAGDDPGVRMPMPELKP